MPSFFFGQGGSLLVALLPLVSAWSFTQSMQSIDLHTAAMTPSLRFAGTKITAKIGDCVPKKKYDLVVVGGGPAGVAGALQGAYLGKRVLLVDKPKAAPANGGLDPLFGGPTGLFSKALRDASKALDIGGLSAMGIDRDVIFKQVRNMCFGLAKNNAQTQSSMLAKFKVDYMQGLATLDPISDDHTDEDLKKLFVRPHARPEDDLTVLAENVLLCTGSFPRTAPGVPVDGKQILDSDSINLGLSFLPNSVVVVGSGIIAIEYSKIFRKLGADVTMVVRGKMGSALERIGIDDTIADRLIAGLRSDDITVLEDTSITGFEFLDKGREEDAEDVVHPEPVRFTLEHSSDKTFIGTINAELYLACVGRIPRARGTSLGLEAAGVKLTERSGHIEVDSNFETSRPGIYAAGDCVPGPSLASTGVDQAQRAVSSMFPCTGTITCIVEDVPYPIGVWTIPEVAYYGLTQKQAIQEGYDADIGIATYDACLRGRVFAPDGMLKLVFDRKDARILGVHIIGTDACELVHYGMDLVAKHSTLFDVINTLFTAVTYHELFKEAALNGNDKLDFGIQWQELLAQLSSALTGGEPIDEDMLYYHFNAIDESGDGSLCADELREVFRKLDIDLDDSFVPNLIRLADEDGNGTVEWPEFLRIFKVMASTTVDDTAGQPHQSTLIASLQDKVAAAAQEKVVLDEFPSSGITTSLYQPRGPAGFGEIKPMPITTGLYQPRGPAGFGQAKPMPMTTNLDQPRGPAVLGQVKPTGLYQPRGPAGFAQVKPVPIPTGLYQPRGPAGFGQAKPMPITTSLDQPRGPAVIGLVKPTGLYQPRGPAGFRQVKPMSILTSLYQLRGPAGFGQPKPSLHDSWYDEWMRRNSVAHDSGFSTSLYQPRGPAGFWLPKPTPALTSTPTPTPTPNRPSPCETPSLAPAGFEWALCV